MAMLTALQAHCAFIHIGERDPGACIGSYRLDTNMTTSLEESVEGAISRHVDAGELAGAATLIWRGAIARLATLPLIDQPGGGFPYGVSTDLLRFLVARLDGAPLGAVLNRRVFAPLNMRDTAFLVPPEKRGRGVGLE